MVFTKKNYFRDLIHYISEFKSISIDTEKELKSIVDYLEVRLDKKSATDTTNLLRLHRLFDKFTYLSKYLDVSLSFYEE